MKEQISIPTSKVQRASKFVKTGAKVGGNYIKHYSKKLFDPSRSRDELDADNAEDIYNSLLIRINFLYHSTALLHFHIL